jgi:2-haloacid dehalogenase
LIDAPVRQDDGVRTTAPPPEAVLLDVNETLTDLHALESRLEAVGAPAELLDVWFAGTLRDGFALTAAGAYGTFAEVASDVLTGLLAGLEGGPDNAPAAAAHVLAGMVELPLHPDVAPGVAALRSAGLRVAALTNGAEATARAVLERGGVMGDIEAVLSIDEVRRWKPAPETYRYGAERLGVPVDRIVLAAVHPWDVDGAERAGLAGAWINRRGRPYPSALLAPEYEAASLVELAGRLGVRTG